MTMTTKKTSEPSPRLGELRERIDAYDAELVRLLNERTQVALEIGGLKKRHGGETYVPARERQVLERVLRLNPGPLRGPSMQAIYREIMSAAIALESPVRVAYLGPPATFTHQAAHSRFGASVEYIACETITDVFTVVQKRNAEYGVVPIENSTDGAVTHTLDELVETSLKICAEVYLPITQHLMSRAPLSRIRRIYSKPEVFGQCRRWLQAHLPGVDLVPVSSTARGAEMAAQEKDSAALASRFAAELNKVPVRAPDVQDMAGNTTRFLVIGKSCGKSTGQDKTSLYFSVRHKVGALHDVLAAFKKNGINMSKIESRPSKTKAWEYLFFVDIDGHLDDKPVARALRSLGQHCAILTVLGSYPKAEEPA